VIRRNSPSEAYIQQIIIDQNEQPQIPPYPTGASRPLYRCDYTIYTCRPRHRFALAHQSLNAIITDINPRPDERRPSSTHIGVLDRPADHPSPRTDDDPRLPNRGGNALNTTR